MTRPLRRSLAFGLAASLALCTAACTYPIRRADWSHYDGPGADVLRQPEVPPPDLPDPLEPANRAIAAANFGFLRAVIDPLAVPYRWLVPKPVRESLLRFSENMLYPRRLAANLLQGKGAAAWDETKRFGVNTTVGLLGLLDPATTLGIPAHDEDFGQVFATWGWQPSTFVSVPFFGPSTVRDAVGLVPDSLSNPVSWFVPLWPWVAVNGTLILNEQSDLVRPYLRFARSTLDAYDLSRMYYLVDREERVARRPPKLHNTAGTQTLEAAFLSPRDPEFPDTLDTGHVESASGESLPYSLRMQPSPAPVLFLVPGLGTHRLDASSLALAELAWDHGFSVAIVSNPMNFEFIERGLREPIPGHVPVDSPDLHVALDRMNADIERRYPGRSTGRVLMGYSLGAFHTLFIAATERDPKVALVKFDRYVALDVPVRLWTAVRALDRYYNALLTVPADEREARIEEILGRAMELGRGELARALAFSRVETAESRGNWTPPRGLPFTNTEAEYLIGLAFRLSLNSILWVSQEREDLGVLKTRRDWFHRWAAYQEMYDYGYQEYFYLFVLPFYRDRLKLFGNADEMIAANDLRSLEPDLRGQEKVRVFINHNDFLRTGDDEAFLVRTFGRDHVTIFATGGHLGGLHKPEVQEEVMESIADLLPDRGVRP